MKRLEYIQSDGFSYIDTNIILGSNFEINLDFVHNSEKNHEQPIISTWSSDFNYWNFFIRANENKSDLYVKAHYIPDKTLTIGTTYNAIITRNSNNLSITVDKITKNITNSTLANNTNKVLILNRGDKNGKSFASIGKVVIKNNNELVGYFIPVEDDDGTACMFDLVTGEYFYNQGTGEFIKGPRLDVYTPIEFLESTGTQYIDTGIQAKPTLKLDFGFQMTNLATLQRIIARTINNSSVTGLNFTFYITSSSQWGYLCENNSTGSYTFTGISVDKNYHKVIFDANESYFDLDNGTYHAAITATKTNIDTKTLYIFAGNYNDSGVERYSKMKLYYCKIYDNNELIRDFIPVLDKNDVPCLYDLVSNTYFYNQGTGNFIGGDVMPMAVADTAGLQQIANNIKGALNTKQNTLTQGTNITITNDVIDVDAVEISNSEIDALFT